MASPTMKNSMMYKMVYYRLDEAMGGEARDYSRNSEIDSKYANNLRMFEEVYSSERLIVRLYKVKDAFNF